jgi:riboflavin kinase/FMN adenylyltransferase
MRVARRIESLQRLPAPRVVTLGNFDGVHLGHQAILRRVVERARDGGGSAIAITFHPHPAAVLSPERRPLLLTSLRQRVEALADSGTDGLWLLRFTSQVAAVEAERFVVDYLLRGLGAEFLVVGERVGFGHRRGGDAALLTRLSRELGFGLEIVGAVEIDGQQVSSSAIRRAVAAGDLETARRMLGRFHRVSGRIVHGLHRGKGLGFPTANLRLNDVQLPPDGVYAVRASVRGTEYPGVANLGFNPTFGNRTRTLETHLFDITADLYGARMDVAFVQRLRGERKFASVEALVDQIRADADAARRVLS